MIKFSVALFEPACDSLIQSGQSFLALDFLRHRPHIEKSNAIWCLRNKRLKNCSLKYIPDIKTVFCFFLIIWQKSVLVFYNLLVFTWFSGLWEEGSEVSD